MSSVRRWPPMYVVLGAFVLVLVVLAATVRDDGGTPQDLGPVDSSQVAVQPTPEPVAPSATPQPPTPDPPIASSAPTATPSAQHRRGAGGEPAPRPDQVHAGLASMPR